MSEQITSCLVPLHDSKLASYRASGHESAFAYHNGLITNEQADLINERIELRLYFGAHGTDPDNYLAAEAAFDDFDPQTTTLCFENVGFSLAAEKAGRSATKEMPVSQRMRLQREAVLSSRNSVGGNYLSNTNAFGYAQRFCEANGYDVRSVDRDSWETNHWVESLKAVGDADNDPIFDELYDEFCDRDWLSLDFTDAVYRFAHLGDRATTLIPTDEGPFVVYRWGEQHRLRETVATRRLKDLALEKATQLRGLGNADAKHTIALFFGAAHRRGIQMRLRELGINFTTILLTDETVTDSASDMPIDGGNAHSMMKSLVSHELWRVYGEIYTSTDQDSSFHPSKLRNIQAAIRHTLDKLPMGALAEFYESYRNYRMWFEQDTAVEEGVTKTSNLARRLAQERRKRENPRMVLEKLIGFTFTNYGHDLGRALSELEIASQESARLLFGR